MAESDNGIEAAISVEKLESLGSGKKVFSFIVGIAQLPGVVKLKLPPETTTDQLFREKGTVSGESVSTTGANNWHAAGVTSEGIKVGIIDPDGFLNYDRHLGTELLPRDRVQVMPGQDTEAQRRRSGLHGTGCAEIITEMAPAVELFLARSTSIVSFSAAIDWMIESDVDVISYSAGRPAEPIDGTGPSGRDVMRAIDAGILWVNSSGNFGLSHLDMTFTDDNSNGFHEFPSGEEILPVKPLAETMLLSLVWDDPWVGAQHNYDLVFLTEGESGELETFASSRNIQAGGNADNPSEQITIATPDTSLFAAITRSGAIPGGRLNLLGHGMDFQYSIPEGSLAPPADLDAVLAVGATNWEDGKLEPYSSQGPTWDGRSKPNVVAPARVNSASYRGPFLGTSASAPHVPGAAALLFQNYPEATESQVRAALRVNASDIGPDGADNQSGSGELFLHEGPDSFTFDVDSEPPNESESSERDESEPTASLSEVSLERVPTDQGDVLRIEADVQIKGLNGQQAQVASFFFFDTGRNIPLKDFNGRFASQVGTVAVGTKINPDSEAFRVDRLELQIPVSELHLGADEQYELKVVTSISSELAWEEYLAISDWNQLVLET